ncbi:MAG: ABC transporter permease [Candidatus Zixiibacteriota bacterium]|nr:MAG: ABC transporter permease [candidate division Zixibacteria bacterium]
MFKNYLKVSVRNLLRNKGYSLINIVGLAVGMACCALIMLWILDELSYDRYHQNADNIYRVTYEINRPNYNPHFARCPYGYVNSLPEEYPEILDLIRFHHDVQIVIKKDDIKFNETRFYNVDPNVFEVFSYELLEGDTRTALSEPGSIVLTRDAARRYFGDTDPMGKTITTINIESSEEKDYKVTGILKDTPENSHFHIDFLASFDDSRTANVDQWNYIYILLEEGSDYKSLESRLPQFVAKYLSADWAPSHTLRLQPLTSIHLYSHIDREIEPNGNILYVYIFALVAIITLLIACINFINLSTARSARRAMEIGLRKTIGSSRMQLITYLLGESLLISLLALVIAVLIIEISLPAFNNLTGKSMSFDPFVDWEYSAVLASLFMVSGLIAGSYPALFLSSFKPVSVLKGAPGGGRLPVRNIILKRVTLRNILVVLQLSATIALIICYFVTRGQRDFMMNQRLGKLGEPVIAVSYLQNTMRDRYNTVKTEFSNIKGVREVTAVMEPPSRQILDASPFTAEGMPEQEDAPITYILPVDSNFIDFFKLELLTGTGFPRGPIDDAEPDFIINESAVKIMGWESPEEAIGKRLELTPGYATIKPGRVIGVVKDFYFSDLKKKIKPLVLFQRPNWYFSIVIKTGPSDFNTTLASIKEKWDAMFPDYPFEFHFVDDLYENIYSAELKQGTILGTFSIVGLFIACLGLLGLAAFITEQRTKEIGIRKALGASVANIISMLTKEFVLQALVATLIAWPIAYLVMTRWLENFAYRVEINMNIFIISSVIAISIALLTVIFQAIKAAVADPVKALKYE